MENTELASVLTPGDNFFYPTIGICSYVKEELRMGEKYMRLYSQKQDSTVLLPLERAFSMGLRRLSSLKEIKQALSILSLSLETESEWKKRVEINQKLINEGSTKSLCKVVSSLYRRQKIKQLPTIEKRLYDEALEMLIDEAKIVLKKNEEETRKVIFSFLENDTQLRFSNSSSGLL